MTILEETHELLKSVGAEFTRETKQGCKLYRLPSGKTFVSQEFTDRRGQMDNLAALHRLLRSVPRHKSHHEPPKAEPAHRVPADPVQVALRAFHAHSEDLPRHLRDEFRKHMERERRRVGQMPPPRVSRWHGMVDVVWRSGQAMLVLTASDINGIEWRSGYLRGDLFEDTCIQLGLGERIEWILAEEHKAAGGQWDFAA